MRNDRAGRAGNDERSKRKMSKVEDEKLRIYREHNVTRSRGIQRDGSAAQEPMPPDGGHGQSKFGVIGEAPNPHSGRCQCDNCREITRTHSRTVANELGER